MSGYVTPKESKNVLQAKYKPTNQDTEKPSETDFRRLKRAMSNQAIKSNPKKKIIAKTRKPNCENKSLKLIMVDPYHEKYCPMMQASPQSEM